MAIADDKGTAKAGRGGIRPDDLLTRTESVVHAELDEALVMLDPDAGRYYELDPVARRVWNLIETETPVAAVRDALTEEYAVDGRTCLRDLLEFVGKMAEHGLLRVRPGRRSGRRREASPPGGGNAGPEHPAAQTRPTIRTMRIGGTATGGHVREKEAAGGWRLPESQLPPWRVRPGRPVVRCAAITDGYGRGGGHDHGRDTWTTIGGFVALGALLLAQYNGINSRFDSIDGRLVAIESRLTEIETRLSSVAERVSCIEGHLSIRPSVEEERQ